MHCLTEKREQLIDLHWKWNADLRTWPFTITCHVTWFMWIWTRWTVTAQSWQCSRLVLSHGQGKATDFDSRMLGLNLRKVCIAYRSSAQIWFIAWPMGTHEGEGWALTWHAWKRGPQTVGQPPPHKPSFLHYSCRSQDPHWLSWGTSLFKMRWTIGNA